jgi:hypothetical protein
MAVDLAATNKNYLTLLFILKRSFNPESIVAVALH